MHNILMRPIIAVVYSDGLAADRFLADVGYSLRTAGIAVAGLVQLNSFKRDPVKCDMAVEELFSSTVLQLSENRGRDTRGCRLDRAILAQAVGLLIGALNEKPDILVLNKFGKVEAEGTGLRDVIALAVEREVPIIVGVPFRNLDQWRIFAADLADECPVASPDLQEWLRSQKILPADGRLVSVQGMTANASPLST